MYHHLAKVDKDIKVAQEDKAGKLAQDNKVDKDIKLEQEDKLGKLV